jgi:hypothetical protein
MFFASQFRQRFRFGGVSGLWQPREGFVHVSNRLADGSFVNAMKLLQLGQQVFTIDAFAAAQLASADQLKDHPHRSGAFGKVSGTCQEPIIAPESPVFGS